MNAKLHLLSIAIASVMVQSCAPPLYHANTINAPLFSDKGEFQATGAHSNSGTEVQVAYSQTENTAWMMNASFGKEDHVMTDPGLLAGTTQNESATVALSEFSEGYRYHFIEAGYGVFRKHVGNSSFRLEAFALLGFGHTTSYNTLLDYIASADMSRFAVHANIGYVGKVTESAFSLRVGYLAFSNMRTGNIPTEQGFSDSPFPGYSNGTVFIDPALTFSFGFDAVKIVLSSGCSFALNKEVQPTWDRSFGSVGLRLRLGGK